MTLSVMDRGNRALWQKAAANRRAHYAAGSLGSNRIFARHRSWAVRTDTRFAIETFLHCGATGVVWHPAF